MKMLGKVVTWFRFRIGSMLTKWGMVISGHGIAVTGCQTGPLSRMSISMQYRARGNPFMLLTLKDKIDRDFGEKAESLSQQFNAQMKDIKERLEKQNAKT